MIAYEVSSITPAPHNSRLEAHVLLNDEGEVICQHKRNKLPLYTKLALEVAKEVAIVNMEQLSILGHHDIVRVAVPDPQHIGSHAIASA